MLSEFLALIYALGRDCCLTVFLVCPELMTGEIKCLLTCLLDCLCMSPVVGDGLASSSPAPVAVMCCDSWLYGL